MMMIVEQCYVLGWREYFFNYKIKLVLMHREKQGNYGSLKKNKPDFEENDHYDLGYINELKVKLDVSNKKNGELLF